MVDKLEYIFLHMSYGNNLQDMVRGWTLNKRGWGLNRTSAWILGGVVL